MTQNEDTGDGELIDAYLRDLRGEGCPPGTRRLPASPGIDTELLQLLDAITDMGDALDALEQDPAHLSDLADRGKTRPSTLSPTLSTPSAPSEVPSGHSRTYCVLRKRRTQRRTRRTASRSRTAQTHKARSLTGIAAAVALVGTSVVALWPRAAASAVQVGSLTSDCRSIVESRDQAIGEGKPHLVVAAVWGGEERKRFVALLERFARQAGVTVALATRNPDPDRDLAVTLERLAAQGCPPDVALLPQPGLLTTLARSGRLTPLDDLTAAVVSQNYSAAWQKLGRVDDTSYGVWFKATNKSIIWFNANAFKKARIAAPPANWDELKDAAAKLRAVDITPFAVAASEKDAWVLSDWFENVYLRTAGHENYEKLARSELAWTDRTVKEALIRLAEIFGNDQWLAGGKRGALETTYEESILKVFGNRTRPEAAMVFEGDFVANEVAGTSSRLGIDAQFFPFPSIGSSDSTVVGAGGPSTGEAGGDVAVLMQGTETGRKFLRYLADGDAVRSWVERGGFISPNRNVDRGAYRDGAMGEAARQLVEAESIHFDLSDRLRPSFGSSPGHGMWKVLQEFLANPADPDRTAQRLEDEFRAAAGGG